jgi:hypothetical protein
MATLVEARVATAVRVAREDVMWTTPEAGELFFLCSCLEMELPVDDALTMRCVDDENRRHQGAMAGARARIVAQLW